MGSNLKKIRSLNLNTKILLVGFSLSVGFLGTFLLNYSLRDYYNSSRENLEDRLEKFLNKRVSLGDYSGIRYLGFSIGNSEIIDKKNINSGIKTKNVYVGIMPLRSFLKQKWILKIRPELTEINIDRDFFKRDESFKKDLIRKKSKSNYELNFNVNKYSILKLEDSGLDTKVKGNVIYKSIDRNIIANLNSKFNGKGFLKLKLNTKLNQDFLKLDLFSSDLDLKNSEYVIGKRKISFIKGNFKSNFKFKKTSTETSCKGKLSFTNLKIKPEALLENINSDSISFFCKDNNLIGKSNNLDYGSLTSIFNLNVPLNKSSNNIDLKGSLGYKKRSNPDLKFSANLSYWIDKRGINFGDIDSSFELNRTQLANLNTFQKNGIDGFITAVGELKGKISDPDISIKFDVTYPQYRGIRIRDTWKGKIKNDKNEYLLNMKNKYYSTIPTFLSVNFDSRLKLNSLNFRRVFNSDVGSIDIVKEEDSYIWSANNFPLDELELSLGNNNQFDRIKGIVNGSGLIALDQSYLDAKFALSFGKYRNIKLANSLFDINLKNKFFYVNSSLYPIDGGIIEIVYNSKNNNLVNVDFNNISTNWTILTAVDIFDFDNKKVIPTRNSNILNDLEINKENNSFQEKIDLIKKINENNNSLEDKFNLQKYLNKFKSRYNGKITVQGNRPDNYKLNAKLNGYLDVSRKEFKNNKDEFSIDLDGGFLRGKGTLRIKKLPLSAANIFLNRPRDFQGGLDMNLIYNLDEKSFTSEISSNNASIKNNELLIDKGSIKLNNSIFNIDFPFLINDSKIPAYIKGSIPVNNKEKLDLRLTGNEKFIDLIDIFAGEYFTFKKGDFNLRIILKGTLNKPLLIGFVAIKDSEIEFYNNVIKDINGRIIFDFDYLEIAQQEKLEAKGGDSGNISIEGSLPFYSRKNSGRDQINLTTKEFTLKTDNLNSLLDSKLNLTGSFEKPVLGGKISLNSGFIDFISTNKKNKLDTNINKKEDKKNWPELLWDFNSDLKIVSNETILNSVLLGKTLPNYLDNLSFNNLILKLGPDFKLQFSESIQAYLDTKLDININGEVGNDLRARGLINLSKGRANLYTTPFKLNKNKDNYILFAERSGVIPYINFSLVSKVPDSIIPIRENNQDPNISGDLDSDATSNGLGAFGIGNTRLIKIEASYEGFLDQLSFEDENKRIQLRSTPSYNRSQIIGLIGGNSANLINRAFISQLNNADALSERFQLSLYPALIENNDSLNNIFSNENLDIDNDGNSTSNEEFSSQAWVAQLGIDLTDAINFAFQTIPGRDDLPPTGIFTFQATPNLELLGSYDANGDWKSQVQIFRRFNFLGDLF